MVEDALSVTVQSLGGDILLESEEVSSIQELAEASAAKLKAKKCRMVSADGNIISDLCHLKNHQQERQQERQAAAQKAQHTLTAVAQNVNPLLQLVGLQNEQGDLTTVTTLAMEQLEHIALDVATTLAHIACWFGDHQHLAGAPSVPWKFGHLLPPPGSFSDQMHLSVGPKTPVVCHGAQVVCCIPDLPGQIPGRREEIKATRELTVEDIVKIRSAHQDECNKNKSKLLEMHPGADTVLAIMRLVRYSAEEVLFELGHRCFFLLREDL